MLANYHLGISNPSQVAEELHTTLEALMRSCLNKPDASFTGLVHDACAAGLMDVGLKDSVLALKDRRRGAKHEGQRFTRNRLDAVLRSAVGACQQLAFAAPAEPLDRIHQRVGIALAEGQSKANKRPVKQS